MSRVKRAKPSPALIVAVVALVAALCGGAVAGVTISKLKPEEKNQVKRISKRQAKRLDKKIELLPGPQGEQGPDVDAFNFELPVVGGNNTVIERDGVRVTANCGAGDLQVLAFPIADGTRVRATAIPLRFDLAAGVWEATTEESSATNNAVVLVNAQNEPQNAAGSVSVLTPSGRVTVIDYDARRGDPNTEAPCRFWGHILSGDS